jgi:hypothetical protein
MLSPILPSGAIKMVQTTAALPMTASCKETISTTEWTVPSGITKDSDNTDAVTIRGVSYGVNTAATIWLSGATVGEHTLTNKITTSDSRTLSQSITIEVKEN